MQGGGPKRIRNGYSEAQQRRRRAFSWPPEATLFWADLGVAPPRRIDFRYDSSSLLDAGPK